MFKAICIALSTLVRCKSTYRYFVYFIFSIEHLGVYLFLAFVKGVLKQDAHFIKMGVYFEHVAIHTLTMMFRRSSSQALLICKDIK